jgi:molybdenum cofactor biosynthesis enzyme MoaA
MMDKNTVTVEMLGTKLTCRNYWCSHYQDKPGDKMDAPAKSIFYLMATNKCNGLCPMCEIKRNFLNLPEPEVDEDKLGRTLADLYGRNLISKISMTGGDPLLNPDRTNKLLSTIYAVNPSAIVDITTNGSLIGNLERLEFIDKLATIHISRHHFDTARNNQVFGVKTATLYGLKHYSNKYPGRISLNCCLIPGFIDSPKLVERYLDWAATIKNLKSAGFISLMDKNEFCRKSVVAEEEIKEWIDSDPNNFDHLYNFDTDICQCRTWKRVAKNYVPLTSFWWKVTRQEVPYCRQLIFTADNRITVNFNEITEISY